MISSTELAWYDYGARYYDPALGRWHSIDPSAESYAPVSPYAYCFSNPIMFTDPWGMVPRYNWYTEKYYDTQTGRGMSWEEVEAWFDAGDFAGGWSGEGVFWSDRPISLWGELNAFVSAGSIAKFAGFKTPIFTLGIGLPVRLVGFHEWENGRIVSSDYSSNVAFSDGKNRSTGGLSNIISEAIPVAYSIEFTGAAEAIGASSMSPIGGILILRGPDRLRFKGFTATGLGVGWVSANAMIVSYTYYYIGSIDNFDMRTFEGWGINNNVSADVGFSVGINVSWLENPYAPGEYLIGIGSGIGVGVGPTAVSGQYTRQFNYIWW